MLLGDAKQRGQRETTRNIKLGEARAAGDRHRTALPAEVLGEKVHATPDRNLGARDA